MELKGKHVGLAVTGSFSPFQKNRTGNQASEGDRGHPAPVFSGSVQSTDSRFGDTGQFMDRITSITEMKPILKIEEAEPIGPKGYLDVLLIAPCTGNTLAKLANGITDTPVLMAAKAHLRNGRPLVISVSTNDALGINLKNIGLLFNMKNIYFVPFGQDDPVKKPTSMIAHTGLIEDTLKEALEGRQYSRLYRGCRTLPSKSLRCKNHWGRKHAATA